MQGAGAEITGEIREVLPQPGRMLKNSERSVIELIIAGSLLLPLCVFAGPAAGDMAPDFDLADLGGKSVSLADMTRGEKPVVLSFFGTWCESCLEEIKDLAVTAPKHNAAVYLVGVDADREKLVRFAAKHKIPFPVLWDPKAGTMGKKYDLLRGAFLVVPKTCIISPAGTIEYAAESYDETRKAALEEKLAALSGRKWDKPSEVAVYFTGSANGRLEARPSGGFIKLVSFLERQAGKYPHRLLLDSGDFLPYGVSAAQAGPVFRALALAGYDAVAVGDQDLSYPGFAVEAAKEKAAFLASNIRFRDGTPGLAEKTVMAGGLKIRIVSFVSPAAFSLYPEEFTAKLEFRGLKEVLGGEKGADFLILLSHAGLAENEKIAAEFGQLDLIIAGHTGELPGQPLKAGNALIVQSGGDLRNTGRLVLRFSGKKLLDHSHELLPLTDDIPDSPLIAAILKEAKSIK